MKTRLLSLFLAAVAVVFTFSACGGGGADTEPGVITTEDFRNGRKYFSILSTGVVNIRTSSTGQNVVEGWEPSPAEAGGVLVDGYGSVSGGEEQPVRIFYRYNNDHTALMNIANNSEDGDFVVTYPDEYVDPPAYNNFICSLVGVIGGSNVAGRQVSVSNLEFDFTRMQV
ncbi:MAG: hypothetical protein ACI4OZ_04075, partial [Akkermansia sp.]